MRILPEKQALRMLLEQKKDFARQIADGYELRAKSCIKCETKGDCCLDAHFVNVHITRLEARQIRNALNDLPPAKQKEIELRVAETVAEYGLSSEGDTFPQTFACPLFEKSVGCLVHEKGKPLPCIAHACYENKADLPPDELLEQRERAVGRLNERTYGGGFRWLPLPVALLADE